MLEKKLPRIAVIIPCLNEEKTIGKVVRDFREQLADAAIYVVDNNSSDRTVSEAIEAGALIIAERRRGKGYAIKSAFQRIQADIYVMVDGDDTYPADAVHKLVEPILEGTADMVVGSRLAVDNSQFRRLNLLGNKIFLYLVNATFGTQLSDVLSGFRTMSHAFVRGLPLFKTGFEVEVEMTLKALERGYLLMELPIVLGRRPEGSYSKIRHLQDGFRILWTIASLLRDYKPLTVFGTTGLVFVGTGLVPGFVAVDEYVRTGLVLHLPSAILAVGMVLAGTLCGTVGLILHTINHRFRELDSLVRALSASPETAPERLQE
ncbi:MAG: glycosyltransferase [Chloroflexi bacterium]|nr:glycosyltransferase [Chloroflexota bacterium]